METCGYPAPEEVENGPATALYLMNVAFVSFARPAFAAGSPNRGRGSFIEEVEYTGPRPKCDADHTANSRQNTPK